MIGTLGLDFPEPLEGLVAVEVGQADVDQGRRVGGLPHQGDRLVGVAGRLDARPLAPEQVVGRAADAPRRRRPPGSACRPAAARRPRRLRLGWGTIVEPALWIRLRISRAR